MHGHYFRPSYPVVSIEQLDSASARNIAFLLRDDSFSRLNCEQPQWYLYEVVPIFLSSRMSIHGKKHDFYIREPTAAVQLEVVIEQSRLTVSSCAMQIRTYPCQYITTNRATCICVQVRGQRWSGKQDLEYILSVLRPEMDHDGEHYGSSWRSVRRP